MNENWKFKRQLLWLTVFAIAMAYMESAVVVYLREIFYPEGFRFPLHPVTGPIAVTEVIREAAYKLGIYCREKLPFPFCLVYLCLRDMGYILLRIPEITIKLAFLFP